MKIEAVEFALKSEFIELCNLLKLTGIAQSGGQGKTMVANGLVQVDGAIELRKTAKIRKGQVVECFNTKIVVN